MTSNATFEMLGTVRPDGTLELDDKVSIPPGRVRVRVESMAATATPAASAPVAPRDEWERKLIELGTDCGVSLPH